MDLSREEQFIMKEFENAATLTFHIDNLRNTLTGFFLTFAGLAAAGLAFLLKGEASFDLGLPLPALIAGLLAFLGVLGLAAIKILAKLRGVQLEHFRIMNNVRKHFLGDNYALWNVVQLSDKTLPKPNRGSGTYYWLVMIMLVTALLFASAAFLTLTRASAWPGHDHAIIFSGCVFLILLVLEDQMYLRGAGARPRIDYSLRSPASTDSSKPPAG
jgi:hypothetical protein